MTIVEFIEARLAEDEQIAQSTIDPERPGTHWCWEDGERDPLQPGVEMEGLDTQAISLRTVEEYPTFVGPLPAFILCQVEARHQGGLWHIARHDPARALREVERNRRVLKRHRKLKPSNGVLIIGIGPGGDVCAGCGTSNGHRAWPCAEVRDLAQVWSEHPDFREEWAA